jgi:hypothetical protein
MDLSERVVPVARRADDPKVGRRIDDLADDAPHEGAVVDDEHRGATIAAIARGHDLPS